MNDLSRWLNPAAAISTEDEALASGRAGAVGAFVSAAHGLFGAALIAVNIDGYLAQLRAVTATMYGESSQAGQAALAMMGPAMVYTTLAMSVGFAAVFAIVGVVQWRKPNAVIPLLLGLLALYSLLMLVLNMANPATASAHMIPAWRQALAVVVDLVCLLLFYNGLRGANRLRKLRDAA
ncbi:MULTISPECIES: hypothetical protein [unclassified Caulobacter]|uniref:hypothetical protein n=1 Tax=unclassified Caulobacter TaxID=2648921 RepID=UPI0004A76013|nr:hypothetical protein [Caulobacter sp. UNC358MFTsu5.1]